MAKHPYKFAVRPESSAWGHADVDALSDVLHRVRLRGNGVVRSTERAPFNIAVPAGVRVMHIVESVGVQLHLAEPTIALGPGDMALLARGEAHRLRAGRSIASRPLAEHHGTLQGEDIPRWVTGYFAVEEEVAEPLLAVLPPAVVVRAGQAEQEWLPLSLKLLLAEIVSPRPGAAVMMSRILDLLFIHALRAWAAEGRASPGWLTAAMHPALARPLRSIHQNPERAWSLDELAALAGQSRSAFTGHFARLLGQSPGAYVTERRIEHAAHLLRSTKTPVGRIAEAVGYASDAAFVRAFRRHYDTSPLQWRKRPQAGTA